MLSRESLTRSRSKAISSKQHLPNTLNASNDQYNPRYLDSPDLDALLPVECKAQSSIRGFRDLYEHEVILMKIFNIGYDLEKV